MISIYIIMTAAELVPCLVRFWRTLASEERGDLKPYSEGQHLQLGRSSHERPDRWIKPSKSIVVSVPYDEVSNSNLFSTGKAFRHPRLDEVHLEEQWGSGMTLAGFEAHIASGSSAQIEVSLSCGLSRGCHLGRFGWVRRPRPGLVMDRLVNCY